MNRAWFRIVGAALFVASAANAQEPETAPADSGAGREDQREQHKLDVRNRFDQLRKLRAQRQHAQQLKRDIDAELAKENPDRAVLAQKSAEYAEIRADRRRDRLLSIRRRWGTLADRPDFNRELERHARTQARIERLKFVAATERSGAARTRLLERINHLAELESERYQKTMQALTEQSRAEDASVKAPGAAE
ncbi:MAG TPA: hypothetical protein VFQ35_17855 [Polyangiaceae bacterium]|nr:hypothetical protein [Polyangiaceae bacterium]